MPIELEPITIPDAAARATQVSVNDALGALHGGSDNVQGLVFPGNLEKHFLMFKIKKRERDTQKMAANENVKQIITLPIPANLSTGYNAKYANAPIGPAGQIAAQIAGQADSTSSLADLISSDAGQEDLRGAVKNIAAETLESQLGALIGGAVGGVGGLATGAAAGNALTGALQGAGVARNPHLAVLFEGVDMRTHQFQYKLIARNEAESSTLREIITQFKLAMAPEFVESNHFFNYPDEFDIEFSKPQFLFKIGTSVLVDFQLNYTAQDGSLFHSNRAPLAVSIALTFQELDIITKQQIREGR